MERGSPTPNSPTYRTKPKDFSIRPRRRRRIYYAAALALGLTLAVILVVYLRQAAVPQRQTSATDSIPAGQSVSSAKPTVSETEAGTYRLEDVEVAPVKAPRTSASKRSTRRQVLAPDAGERPTEYRSLPNGARISPDVGSDGHGLLAVDNGTSEDAKVVLYDTAKDEKIREVYVQAGNSIRITGIPTGTYQLKYTTGLDWFEQDEVFRVNPSYNAFEKEFRYTEQEDGNKILYHDISVTLHPVVGGKAHTRKISRREFLMGGSRNDPNK
jgi:hypothetical protein